MLAVTVRGLALSDYGTYQCVAENDFGRSVGDMSIFGMFFYDNQMLYYIMIV